MDVRTEHPEAVPKHSILNDDDVVVTATGADLISRVPVYADEIEALMRGQARQQWIPGIGCEPTIDAGQRSGPSRDPTGYFSR